MIIIAKKGGAGKHISDDMLPDFHGGVLSSKSFKNKCAGQVRHPLIYIFHCITIKPTELVMYLEM